MCGIIGIVGKSAGTTKESIIGPMLDAISSRGPDDTGIARFEECLLGHNRLSIIDISGGHQPMKDKENRLAIVFNGEIYNHGELRKELEEKGHKFSTRSDTEVILKSYAQYGEEAPRKLEGMFSFAIWDENKRKLFAARDRFGEKPFFYATSEDKNFIFASEIKALLASGIVDKELSKEAIDAYLSFMYVPPNMTIYSSVKVLPPASFLVLENGGIRIARYWKLEKRKLGLTYGEAKLELKRLMEKSVKKMMVADVEVGAFLSGGVDSTLTTFFAQKDSSKKVKTFSLGYEDHINELPYAAAAARKFGTDHFTLQAKGDMTESLIEVTKYLDEPHGDCSNFPQYTLSKLAASKVKVALTGDGADELFMGYGRYWRSKNLSWRAHFYEKAFLSPFEGFVKSIEIFNLSERKRLWGHPLKRKTYMPKSIARAKMSDLDKINAFDLEFYLPGQLLVKGDRTSMMCSLEIRCPFLDRELAEFAHSLPAEFKVDENGGKIILKDILAEIMPKEFVNRRKQGFGAPIKEWLVTPEMRSLVDDTLATGASIYKHFREEEVRNIKDEFYTSASEDSSYKLWSIFNLALWLKLHDL